MFLLKLFDSKSNIIMKVVRKVYTLLVVFFGWILFRFDDMAMSKTLLKTMFGLNGNAFSSFETNTVVLNYIVFIVVCIIASTPLVKMLACKLRKLGSSGDIRFMYVYNALNVIIPVILLFISTIALIGNSYNPFIYFRF